MKRHLSSKKKRLYTNRKIKIGDFREAGNRIICMGLFGKTTPNLEFLLFRLFFCKSHNNRTNNHDITQKRKTLFCNLTQIITVLRGGGGNRKEKRRGCTGGFRFGRCRKILKETVMAVV